MMQLLVGVTPNRFIDVNSMGIEHNEEEEKVEVEVEEEQADNAMHETLLFVISLSINMIPKFR